MANVKNLKRISITEKIYPHGTWDKSKVIEEETFCYTWDWTDEDGTTRQYKTYAHGDGLAIWADASNGWKQLRGTCDFSLPASTEAARKKLNRMYNGNNRRMP